MWIFQIGLLYFLCISLYNTPVELISFRKVSNQSLSFDVKNICPVPQLFLETFPSANKTPNQYALTSVSILEKNSSLH